MSKALNEMREHISVLPAQERGTDTFQLTAPKSEAYYGCLLTPYESSPDSGAQIVAQPMRGAQGSLSISVKWWHSAGNKVRYQIEAFTSPLQPSTILPSPTRQVTGFLPSRNGFHFNNAFPSVPDITIPIPFGRIELGDASNGLCGGMVFAALDYFVAARPIPDITTPPTNNPLFDYIFHRLLDSFNLPLGLVHYITLMQPDYPDAENTLSKQGIGPHGRSWHTIRQEWPAIKTILDTGQPCPLGLIRVKTKDVSQIGNNHQVLATGYDVNDDNLIIYIYDPNYHDFDYLTLTINLATPEEPTPIIYSAHDDKPVYAFFHVDYKPQVPPSS